MKKIVLMFCILFIASIAQAQCVAEIKDVIQDEVRGSVVVETEYTLNGTVVQQGRTRYDESSGTNEEIILKAKEDIAIHCENLIRRIYANELFRQTEALKIQKNLTASIITEIKPLLVGYLTSKTEAIDEFKGQQIKVTADEKNTVTDSISVSK